MKGKIEALLNGDPEAKQFFLEEIRRVALQSKMESLLRTRIGDDYPEEVLSALILKLFSMKEAILRKEEVNRSYIRKVIRSCLVDAVNKEAGVTIVSTNNPVKYDEEGRVREFEELFGHEENKDMEIEAKELFDEILSILSEKDIDTLCYYLNTKIYKREVKIKGMSKDALYKRWERLRKKIRKRLAYMPSEEEIRVFAERFLSEVCAKRGYK